MADVKDDNAPKQTGKITFPDDPEWGRGDMKDDGCEDAYWLKRRHEYAGLAMLGLLANPTARAKDDAYRAEAYAADAVIHADALIAELKKE